MNPRTKSRKRMRFASKRVVLAAMVCASLIALTYSGVRSIFTKPDTSILFVPVPDDQEAIKRVLSNYRNDQLVPKLYFSSKDELEICQAISDSDHVKLEKLLKGRTDLNGKGKDGVTFLFWAWMVNDLKSFRILLDAGADPDLKVSDTILVGGELYAIPGDSVLFASLRHIRGMEFLDLAIRYTTNVNQLCDGGLNLIQVYFYAGASAQGPYRIDRLLASCIDFNRPSPDGRSVSELAVDCVDSNFRGEYECIWLIEAGAPTMFEGRSLYDHVCDLVKRRSTPNLENLKLWMEMNGYATTSD